MKNLEIEISREIKQVDKTKFADKTGAACFKSIGFASCQDGITKKVANEIASRLNVSVRFYESKSCSQINCKP